ncbi:MAG: Mammalian cell entry related domain protein [Flavipsychrobacter sp.]|jgi:phospholipid/cholesterol/gamma-HCH transport system substrate-binding protein|nr:Mammalian cell entry related domain protein [Flavipsychrobacter sp.]
MAKNTVPAAKLQCGAYNLNGHNYLYYFYLVNGKPEKKNNVKTLVWITVIVLAVAGYYFLKDSNVFVTRFEYYAYFADVQGLQPSSPVMVKGVRVGKISNIDINRSNVRITLAVSKSVRLPEGTVAKLAAGGITGEKIIDLKLGNGTAILPDYATLQTGLDTSLLPVSVRFTPIFETAKFMLRTADTTLQSVNSLFRTGLLSRSAVGVVNLEQKMHGLSNLSNKLNNEHNVQAILGDAASQSQRLAANSSDFNRSVNNAVQTSGKLAKTNIADDLTHLQSSFRKLGRSFYKLDTATSGFGKLINTNNTYQSLSTSFDTLNRGWQRLHKDPPGISIFGKKKK